MGSQRDKIKSKFGDETVLNVDRLLRHCLSYELILGEFFPVYMRLNGFFRADGHADYKDGWAAYQRTVDRVNGKVSGEAVSNLRSEEADLVNLLLSKVTDTDLSIHSEVIRIEQDGVKKVFRRVE